MSLVLECIYENMYRQEYIIIKLSITETKMIVFPYYSLTNTVDNIYITIFSTKTLSKEFSSLSNNIVAFSFKICNWRSSIWTSPKASEPNWNIIVEGCEAPLHNICANPV